MKTPVQPQDSKPVLSDADSAAAGFFERHPVIAAWFDRFMTGLLLVIVFGIGGALVFLRAARKWIGMTPKGAWVCFGVGGTAAVGWLLWVYFRKPRPPVI